MKGMVNHMKKILMKVLNIVVFIIREFAAMICLSLGIIGVLFPEFRVLAIAGGLGLVIFYYVGSAEDIRA